MDQERTVHTMSDEALEREIENALAVDPSPEFLARVRTRIAIESSTPAAWRLPWRVVGIGTLVTTVGLTLVIAWSVREPNPVLPGPVALIPTAESAQTRAPIATTRSPSAAEAPAGRSVELGRVRVRPAALTKEPEILISPGDAAALRVLIMNIHEGRIDATVLNAVQRIATPLEPLGEIVIQPIAIEPLPRLALLEGERP